MLLLRKITHFNHFWVVFALFFLAIAPPPVSAQDSTQLVVSPPPVTENVATSAVDTTQKTVSTPNLPDSLVAKGNLAPDSTIAPSTLLVVVDSAKNLTDTIQIVEKSAAIVVKLDSNLVKLDSNLVKLDSNLVKSDSVNIAKSNTKSTLAPVLASPPTNNNIEKKAEKPTEKASKRALPVMPPAKFVILRSTRQGDAKTRNNGVIYLNDTAKIRSLEALLDNNRAYAHHCGQAWSMSFWQSSSEKVDEISINPDCEQFEHNTKQINATVRDLAAQIDGSGAPHYLYNLKLSSAFPPDLVESELSEHFQLLFMGGRFQHLPSVTFRVVQSTPLKGKISDEELEKVIRRNRAKGRDRTEAVIEAVKQKFRVEATGKIQNPISGADDTNVEDAFDVTLKFNKDANLEAIATYINENGGNTTDKRVPEFYYIQAVSQQKSLQVVRDFVAQHFEYVRDIFDYPNKK